MERDVFGRPKKENSTVKAKEEADRIRKAADQFDKEAQRRRREQAEQERRRNR